MYIILGILFALTLTYYLVTKKKGLFKRLGIFAFMFVFVSCGFGPAHGLLPKAPSGSGDTHGLGSMQVLPTLILSSSHPPLCTHNSER